MSRAVTVRLEAAIRKARRPKRQGTVLVMAAFMMIVMMALLALSVDLGYMTTVNTELKRATDSAALAGAACLVDGTEVAKVEAFKFRARNPVGGALIAELPNWEEQAAQWIASHPDEFKVQWGHWHPNNPKPQPGDQDDPRFVASDQLPSTIRVQTVFNNAPLFFGRLFGKDSFNVKAESVARYQPRDIALVLDFSGSMNYDSQLRRITDFGASARAAVEASLLEIYQDLGSPRYGNMTFAPVYISSTTISTVKANLGLTSVPYPYASGSWDDYISYVQTSSYINNAGYRKKYGYLTLINYWLEQKPKYNQTVDLWKVRAQPIATVKDCTGVFMQYIQEVDTGDRVAFVIYNSPSQDAQVDQTLTEDFAAVANLVQHRQAAHYDLYTNIGAGIRKGLEELQAHGREGAFKMIVLMTDGNANRPTSETYARTYALQQAAAVKAAGYPIICISLSNDADSALLQQIADITEGYHFNVPGGSSVTDYRDALLQVFRQIADHRPLVLVK